MNDEAARQDRLANSPPQRLAARAAPALLVHVALERRGVIRLHADSFEDEQRLRAWLRSSRAIWDLHTDLERLLDPLERDGGWRAA
jgi:hypothetical protein